MWGKETLNDPDVSIPPMSRQNPGLKYCLEWRESKELRFHFHKNAASFLVVTRSGIPRLLNFLIRIQQINLVAVYTTRSKHDICCEALVLLQHLIAKCNTKLIVCKTDADRITAEISHWPFLSPYTGSRLKLDLSCGRSPRMHTSLKSDQL